jgi:negative regulator of sigma-B (phosphoserine phosphatase)
VGFVLPPLRAATLPVYFGDTLIFATDGISDKFSQEALPDLPPDDIAAHMLSRYAKQTDDALVLVARYVGSVQ